MNIITIRLTKTPIFAGNRQSIRLILDSKIKELQKTKSIDLSTVDIDHLKLQQDKLAFFVFCSDALNKHTNASGEISKFNYSFGLPSRKWNVSCDQYERVTEG